MLTSKFGLQSLRSTTKDYLIYYDTHKTAHPYVNIWNNEQIQLLKEYIFLYQLCYPIKYKFNMDNFQFTLTWIPLLIQQQLPQIIALD